MTFVARCRADSIQGKERLLEEFGSEEDGDNGEAGKGKDRVVDKPDEHKVLFEGNTDDHFRLGIKITRGAVRPC